MPTESFSIEEIQHLRSRLEALTIENPKSKMIHLTQGEAGLCCIGLFELEKQIQVKKGESNAH